MGMIAEYLMVDEESLNSLMDLNNDDLTDKLFEIEESEKFERIDIDKIWDSLHCFLTGMSASQPIEDDKLSEAIVGVHNFNVEDEQADFVSYIKNGELSDIITAIEGYDFEWYANKFEPKILEKRKVYPEGIWNDDKMQLLGEFKNALTEILGFYKKALNTNHHIIVSIL